MRNMRRFRSSCVCAKHHHLLDMNTFCCIQWFCYRALNKLIRLRGCTGWSGPSRSAYARIHVFAWDGLFSPQLEKEALIQHPMRATKAQIDWLDSLCQLQNCHVQTSPVISLRLSRMTAYHEAKIWSRFKLKNLTTGDKILCKWGEIAISPLFHNIFNIPLTSGVKLHIHLLNVVIQFMFFLNSANLICRGTDISKYFRESLGLRDNESRLYTLRIRRDTCTLVQME